MFADVEANVRRGSWAMRPSASWRYARYGRSAWTETGGDALSLSAPEQTFASAQAETSLHVARVFGRLRPDVSTSYRRELAAGQTTTTLQLSDSADGLFLVNGLPLARDIVTARTGLTFQTDRFDLTLAFDARHGSGQTRRALQFGLGF
jgi:outer membrane autotransporter protein